MQQAMGTAAAYTTGIGDVGTVGYIDPEYIRRHVYHRYCDVYSMGIVMLQIASGPRECTMPEQEATREANRR